MLQIIVRIFDSFLEVLIKLQNMELFVHLINFPSLTVLKIAMHHLKKSPVKTVAKNYFKSGHK